MTTGYLGSAELTNVLLIVLIVVIAVLGGLSQLRRTRAFGLRSRVRMIESLIQGADRPDSPMHTWLVAEAALLAQIGLQLGIEVLDSDDPAWDDMRRRKMEELAARDPGLVKRIWKKVQNLPEPVRAVLIEVFKKLNGALEHMIPFGEKAAGR